jgi:hypothetical protein
MFVRAPPIRELWAHGKDAASLAAGTLANIDGHPGRLSTVTFNARSHHPRTAVRAPAGLSSGRPATMQIGVICVPLRARSTRLIDAGHADERG